MKKEIVAIDKHQALFYVSSDHNTLLTVWRDSKIIHLLSNLGEDQLGEVERASIDNDNNFRKTSVSCPITISTYSRQPNI